MKLASLTNVNFHALARTVVGYARKQSPLIMTATAIGGVVVTTVLAAKAGALADVIVEDMKDQAATENIPLTEQVKATWKVWIPTATSGLLTIGSIVLIHHTHSKRYAALMGLYALGNQAFQEYRESVDELVDDKTKDSLREKVVKKMAARDPEEVKRAANEFGHLTLCQDQFSGRTFYSSMDAIKRAENQFNKDLIHHTYGCLNEFYTLLGVGPIDAGEDVGWNSDKLLSVGYNSVLLEEGVPVLSIDFHDSMPTHSYHRHF